MAKGSFRLVDVRQPAALSALQSTGHRPHHTPATRAVPGGSFDAAAAGGPSRYVTPEVAGGVAFL
jgi:hypothetical protein